MDKLEMLDAINQQRRSFVGAAAGALAAPQEAPQAFARAVIDVAAES
jgi:hypothetical protein